MNARSLAIVTCKKLPDLSDDDRLFLPHLEAEQIKVSPAIWTDPKVDWGSFDAIVFRSPWDYFLHVK